MKVAKRIRVNARLPDHQDKFRDEITQEFTIELDDGDPRPVEPEVPGLIIAPGAELTDLEVLINMVNKEMDHQLEMILRRIKKLGGRDYTER